jgi:hypothetical protein
MNLGGLSALYPGYLQGEQQAGQNEFQQMRLAQLETQMRGGMQQQAGGDAWGRALGLMFGQGAPPPPMPGQSSVPAGPASPPPGPQLAAADPNSAFGGRFGAWEPTRSAGGGLPAMQPPGMQRPVGASPIAPLPPMGGGAPPGPPQPMAGQPPGGGMPSGGGGGGQVTPQTLMQAIVQANPGAPPQVLMQAFQQGMQQFGPIMAQQSHERIAQTRAGGGGGAGDGQLPRGWTQQSIDTAAELFNKTGKMPTNIGTRVVAGQITGQIRTRAAEMAEEQGLSAQDLAKNWQKYKAAQVAIQRFESGPQGNTARSLNVAIDHLSTVDDLAKALKNGDTLAFNRLAQAIAEQTGSATPTNLDNAKAIVGPEIIKAIGIAGAGTKEEREKAADAWNRARSPEQLAGATATIKKLLAGQLRGLKQQYIKSTGLPAKEFDDMMLPETLRQLGGLEGGGAKPSADGWSIQEIK